jgi:hypothetical protein
MHSQLETSSSAGAYFSETVEEDTAYGWQDFSSLPPVLHVFV